MPGALVGLGDIDDLGAAEARDKQAPSLFGGTGCIHLAYPRICQRGDLQTLPVNADQLPTLAHDDQGITLLDNADQAAIEIGCHRLPLLAVITAGKQVAAQPVRQRAVSSRRAMS